MTDKDKKEVKQMMIDVIVDFWEQMILPNVAMKSDLEKFATKDDLTKVEHKVDSLANDVRDIKKSG